MSTIFTTIFILIIGLAFHSIWNANLKRKQEEDESKRYFSWVDAQIKFLTELQNSMPKQVKEFYELMERDAPKEFAEREPVAPETPWYRSVPGYPYTYNKSKDPSDAYSDGIERARERYEIEQENLKEKIKYESERTLYEEQLAEYSQKKAEAEKKRNDYLNNHKLKKHPAVQEWEKYYQIQIEKWKRENPEPPFEPWKYN